MHDDVELQKGDELVLTEAGHHGDWKTASIFPDRWPALPVGEVVIFERQFTNFYGRWFTVVTKGGKSYDLEPHLLLVKGSGDY
jgi:hypothetical protein